MTYKVHTAREVANPFALLDRPRAMTVEKNHQIQALQNLYPIWLHVASRALSLGLARTGRHMHAASGNALGSLSREVDVCKANRAKRSCDQRTDAKGQLWMVVCTIHRCLSIVGAAKRVGVTVQARGLGQINKALQATGQSVPSDATWRPGPAGTRGVTVLFYRHDISMGSCCQHNTVLPVEAVRPCSQ
jgi:hypothetical protein